MNSGFQLALLVAAGLAALAFVAAAVLTPAPERTRAAAADRIALPPIA